MVAVKFNCSHLEDIRIPDVAFFKNHLIIPVNRIYYSVFLLSYIAPSYRV